jgi:transposase
MTMSKRPRRNHAPLFKAKVAVDAIKGEKTLAELAKVHANQIADWKNQLLNRAGSVFGAESASPPMVDLKELHAKIGQLALENDFLTGALNWPPGPFCRMGKACERQSKFEANAR